MHFCCENFKNQKNFVTLRSIQEVSDHPFWMKFITNNGTLVPAIENKNEAIYPNSQSLPKCFSLHVNLIYPLQKIFCYRKD